MEEDSSLPRRLSHSESLLLKKVAEYEAGSSGEGGGLKLSLQHQLDRLCVACKAGDLEKANDMLESAKAEKLSINNTNSQGETPLSFACESGNLDLVMCLVQDFGADVNRQSKDGMTPLHTAAGFNRLEVLKYLLARGGKLHKVDGEGQTALQVATSFGFDAMVEVLKLAETDKGMEQLKIEILPGYEEDKKRRVALAEAKRLQQDAKEMAQRKDMRRQQRDSAAAAALSAHQELVKERRLSMSMGAVNLS